MFLLSSMAEIHLQIAGSMPCLSAACFIVSKEVLSKAPSVSRNAPLIEVSRFMLLPLYCKEKSHSYPLNIEWGWILEVRRKVLLLLGV
jgi:hypothetical protein